MYHITVDYDHNTMEFKVTDLETLEVRYIPEAALYGENYKYPNEVKARFLKEFDASQWKCTDAAKTRINEIIEFNCTDT